MLEAIDEMELERADRSEQAASGPERAKAKDMVSFMGMIACFETKMY